VGRALAFGRPPADPELMGEKMMKRVGIGGLLAAIAFFGSGCAVVGSSQVDPSTVWTKYAASFDAGSGQLELSATFTVGGEFGTFLELDGPSEVRADDAVMTEEKGIFNDVHYVRRVSATAEDLLHDYRLTYVNNAGQSFANLIRAAGDVAIGAGQAAQASLRARYLARWEARDPVRAGETVTATLTRTGPEGGGSALKTATDPGSTGQIVFEPEDLATIGAGPARLTICRSISREPAEAPKGGRIESSYCSAPFALTVVP
jgi:hypothetical protein